MGFRDPFIIQRGDGLNRPWRMLVGSGVKGKGGTLLLYESGSLLEGAFIFLLNSTLPLWPAYVNLLP